MRPTGTSVIYQPAAAVANTTTGSLRAVGEGGPHDPQEGGRRLETGLCVRVDDSAWSRPLNIAVQGAGGPFQVRRAHPSTFTGAPYHANSKFIGRYTAVVGNVYTQGTSGRCKFAPSHIFIIIL